MKLLSWKSWLRKKEHKGKDEERGSVSVVTALAMVVFALAAGLAIDVSHMYLTGTELQNAADAAAIAGASKLDGYAGGISLAIDTALQTQNNYDFAKEVASFSRSDVQFGINANDLFNGTGYNEAAARALADRIRFIKVTIPNKSISVPFAQLALGTSTVALSRMAVAGMAAGCNTLCDSLIPVSVVQDPSTNAPLNVNSGCPNKKEFWPGCTYTVRLGNNGNGSGFITPGNYLILALEGKGGSDTRTVLAGGTIGCFKPGDEVLVKTGVTTGPVSQGWNTRFDDYGSGLSWTDYPPDLNVKGPITYDQYRGKAPGWQKSPNHPGKDFRRVVIIPIVNANEYDSGRGTVRINKFGAFFLQDKVSGSGDISVEFITMKVNVTECQASSLTDNQFSVPTLYK